MGASKKSLGVHVFRRCGTCLSDSLSPSHMYMYMFTYDIYIFFYIHTHKQAHTYIPVDSPETKLIEPTNFGF